MWIHDLGEFYEDNLLEEGWGGLSIARKKGTHGVKEPELAKPGLSYRNNKIGMNEPTMAASSTAGNVQFGNPYEQEEGMGGPMAKKADIAQEIEKSLRSLDDASPSDRVAIMEISKLKERLMKL